MYGIIEDNKIIGPVSLKKRWNGIKGFDKLSDEEKQNHGWYKAKVVDCRVSALEDFYYESEFKEGVIIFTKKVRPKPDFLILLEKVFKHKVCFFNGVEIPRTTLEMLHLINSPKGFKNGKAIPIDKKEYKKYYNEVYQAYVKIGRAHV